MKETLKSTWPLFFGIAMIMLASGLQGTLLAVRATMEDFGIVITGITMAMYYAGFIAGSLIAPKLIKDVGHIRVFAAMASLASTTILIQGLFVTPFTWGAVRIITGFAYATLLIVIESWLNDTANNKTRGVILGSYLVTTYLSMFLGQFLMNVSPPSEITLFVMTSIIISLALLPISLSNRPAPHIETPESMSIKELFKAAPTGFIGILINGITCGVFWTIAPAFAIENGYSIQMTANLMAAFIIGGVLGQFPIGYISDHYGRRMVLLFITFAAAFAAFLGYTLIDNIWVVMGATFLLGFFSLSIYPVCASYIVDYLKQEKFVSANAKMILIFGFGSFIGPIVITSAMKLLGSEWFFLSVAISYATLLAIGIARRPYRTAMDVEDQGDHLTMPIGPTAYTAVLVEDDDPATASASKA